MFATNFSLANHNISSIQGEDHITSYLKADGIDSGNTMTSCFCRKCGTLMYRISSGSPDRKVLRVGTVDDFQLHETILRPRIEQFAKDRVSWFEGGVGVRQYQGNFLNRSKI